MDELRDLIEVTSEEVYGSTQYTEQEMEEM